MKKRKTAQNSAPSTGVRGFTSETKPAHRKILDVDGRCNRQNARKRIVYSVHYGWLVHGEPKMFTIYMGSLGEAYKLWQYLVNGIDGIESYHIERVQIEDYYQRPKAYTPVQYWYETLEDVLLGHAWYWCVNTDDMIWNYGFTEIEWLGGCKEVLRRSEIK